MNRITMGPKVSVCIVTYNQERYIQECLQSIVGQVTNFKFEVIVSDDCSTDGTRGIIDEFALNYPDVVQAYFQPSNVGPSENFVFVHTLATGKYIAHLDGDDYALQGKLQVQSDYLDAHPECNICWHRVLLRNELTGKIVEDLVDVASLPPLGFNRGDLIQLVAIGMNSAKMYRSSVRNFELPDFPLIDYFVNVEQIRSGVAQFVGREVLGVYRVGIGIASSGMGTKRLTQKSFLFFMRKYPRETGRVGAAALLFSLAAAKNADWAVVRLYLAVVVRCLRLTSFVNMWRARNVIPMLRFPRSVR